MESLSDHADQRRELDVGLMWQYVQDTGRSHHWVQRLPLAAGRLICMECHAEHTIADLQTASHFCPVRVPTAL